MSKQSRNEPEKRHYNLDYGFNAELEWFFNAAGTELGEHGSAWREIVSGIPINTESSDLVVGWGKCMVSSPEKYRRVMSAFRRLPATTLEILAARYAPITAHSAQLENRNELAWNVQLTAELKWVALVVARAADKLDSLFADIESGTANKSKQKGHKSWLAKAEHASRTAHEDFLRARMSDDAYRRQVVGSVAWRPTSAGQLASTAYTELLSIWDRELHPTPLSEPEPKRAPRKSRNIHIESGVEWALA